ncbi:hypothetical protein C4D60_Mb08t00400 [Musa balbisiana]|uniref:DUF3700 domain-containing protein n=1 Tax=Musa balbisiana TaxID=52838 RepID=A0A4S8K0B5_MUSBA|nr:hypothetical protein C4D60_Mb08t00400 [Musa balbisiana]
MLGVFSGEVVEVPEELVVAGSRTPSPKTRAAELMNRFLGSSAPAVSIQLGYLCHLAYSHTNQSPFAPRLILSVPPIFLSSAQMKQQKFLSPFFLLSLSLSLSLHR